MGTLDAATFAAIVGVIMALIKIIERMVDRRKNGNGSMKVEVCRLGASLHKAIYDAERETRETRQLMQTQVEISHDMKLSLALMADRDCPYGRRTPTVVGGD